MSKKCWIFPKLRDGTLIMDDTMKSNSGGIDPIQQNLMKFDFFIHVLAIACLGY